MKNPEKVINAEIVIIELGILIKENDCGCSFFESGKWKNTNVIKQTV